MSVRAKFTVDEVSRRKFWGKEGGYYYGIKMSPVTTGTDEDKAFFASTPQGSIDLGVVNEGAALQFEPGKAYYIDFTPAE